MARPGLFFADANGGSVFNGRPASGSMFSFGDVNRGNKSGFFRSFDQDEDESDELEEYLRQPEKKRRLTADQLQFLEKSFEVENKLEPDRKIQLAKELGLQPRQIAIWFQNRRARWKTKQLETHYDSLRNKYDNLKADYSNLLKEKEDLKTEVIRLTDKLILKEKETDIKNLSDTWPKEYNVDPVFEDEMPKMSTMDLIPAKSDVFDSESPHNNDGIQSCMLDQGDSSYVFEADQSDLSQDEEENFSKHLLAKVGHDHCPMTTSNLNCFGLEDEGFGFWSF